MRFVTRALAAAVLGFTASLASAALSSSDWRESGDGLLTVDSVTGLAWLDLTQTSGLSFDAVVAGTWQAEELEAFSKAGENAGQTVTYRNIVTSWDGLGDWTGLQPLEISAHVEGPDQTVVILQEDGPASILAAARAE